MPAPSQGPRLLVIAGHDPSGGAGIDADRDALRDLPVDLDVVITARTDQDDAGVRTIGAAAVAEWTSQARGFLSSASAVKFGLLPGIEHIRAAAALARSAAHLPIIVDPVIAASSGARFLDTAAVTALRDELLPTGAIITPNLDEAAELADIPRPSLEHPEARVDAARRLLDRGARAVLLKGGHATESPLRDLLLEPGGEPHWLEHPRHPGTLRGTGCRLATALAAHLALATLLPQAVEHAIALVTSRISAAPETPS